MVFTMPIAIANIGKWRMEQSTMIALLTIIRLEDLHD